MGVNQPLTRKSKGEVFGDMTAKKEKKASKKIVKLGSAKFKKPQKKKDNETVTVEKEWKKAVRPGGANFKTPQKQKDNESENVENISSRKAEKKKLTDKRKSYAKPHFELGKEVVALWEKLRQRNLKSNERASFISAILEKMKGKIPDMVTSHITSRVLQTCVKYCNSVEKAAVYEELRPHFLALARNTYAHHLVIKILDQANKDELQKMISSLHGNVVTFIRHPVGSAVVEHAYKLANSGQKQELLAEFFSPEYRLFKGIIAKGDCRLIDLLAKEAPSKRASVLEHMTTSLQPILEKGIVDHSIVHRALVEYLSIASKTATSEVVQQLSGPLLIRMIHTKDGAKIGVTCVAASSRKERKKIIKGLKGNVSKVAFDEHGSVVLLAILDVVDDTDLVNKFVISELAKNVKEVALHKYGRRVLLHLLSPYTARYFPCDVLSALQIPTKFTDQIDQVKEDEDEDAKEVMKEAAGSSKKDPFVRRLELLTSMGLAENLVEVCTKYAGELLRSPLGTDVIYEVAKGGSEGVMWQATPTGVTSVHVAIAELGAKPPRASAAGDQDSEEHVFEQYHSSRTIRRLILDTSVPSGGIEAPSFSSILWNTSLKGKCELWAKGHSEKVVSAFRQCADLKVKEAAMVELQSLIDSGLLQNSSAVPDKKGTKRKRSVKAE